MPYSSRPALEKLIPPAFLTEALDDDGDGIEDEGLFDGILAEADGAVDAYLARRFDLPLAAVPALIAEAAKIFAAELIFQRRGMHDEKNPFSKRADGFRATLEKLATGQISLGPATAPARPPISLVTEPAGTVPRSRLNG